jgi:hypothetical protein
VVCHGDDARSTVYAKWRGESVHLSALFNDKHPFEARLTETKRLLEMSVSVQFLPSS